MSKPLSVNFDKLSTPKSGTLVLVAGKDGVLGSFATSIDDQTDKSISRALTASKFNGKDKSIIRVWAPANTNLDCIVIVGAGDIDDRSETRWLNYGGTLMGHVPSAKSDPVALALELPGAENSELEAEELAIVAGGMRLRHYKFDKYKSKKKEKDDDDKSNGQDNDENQERKISLLSEVSAAAKRDYNKWKGITDGVFLARDVVNEPPNVLGPEEFAKKAKELEKLDVDVEILTEKDMKKLNMNALLGVAIGSDKPARLAIMQWNGARKKSDQPIAFIGKGVTFDTGGISLKPPAGMEDMKGDMGGAAAVIGLMHALAARKARVNAIGILGLVENMPDGKAQRPGDIVTSMSGQTIEILNTDAEGRLVLADALWYCQDRFKPQFMIDLATLTGAVLVALGKENAGLFSNNDELAERLHQAGQDTGEKVWRLPLSKEYDKMIDAKFADVKNTGGRHAGSITAAQFLQRFVNDVPWAHLDVAGTAMSSPASDINKSWGSGFGVRLLDKLVADHYED